MKDDSKMQLSRRDFLKTTGLTALATGVGGALTLPLTACAKSEEKANKVSGGPYNILMIVTDQERHMDPNELPMGYRLPGHERLAKQGIVFENHQIGSCVSTPSRAVIYTGQHIQNKCC